MNQKNYTLKQARPVTPLGILVEKLEEIVNESKLTQISPSLANKIESAYELASGIDPYLEKHTTQESLALASLADRTSKEPWEMRFSDKETLVYLEQEMLSGHIEGQTLKMFVAMTKAKNILEIGMFTGYGALAMAEALPDDGKIIACEIDPYVANFAIKCFNESPHGNKIKVEIAPALETMNKLVEAGESFDFVFIDADKGGYIDYLKLLLDTPLLALDGWICVDNTLLQGQPYLSSEKRSENGEAIARFNDFVTQESRVEQVLIPLRDGLTIIKRK